MSAECPGCGGPVKAIPGYESRTTYCSRACQVRTNRRRNKKGVADLVAEVERLRAERDALRSVVRHYHQGDVLAGGSGWSSDGPEWQTPPSTLAPAAVPVTEAEADAILNAIWGTGR